MSEKLFYWLSAFSMLVSAIFMDAGSCHTDCHAEGFWSVERILAFQKVSDILIAAAYFSIPFELLYFATYSNLFPFRCVILHFVAFIVLCGLSHLLTVFTYEANSFHLMLALTISKCLTALVSSATAIILLTLIPLLLKAKLRESLLRIKARELKQEVGLMKKQEEASWHVLMLIQEIRKSLDRHTILNTTLVELSRALTLQNCALWMPNEDKTQMSLTHELRQRSTSDVHTLSLAIDDPDVMEINEASGAKLLKLGSLLGSASTAGVYEHGRPAAIRVPLLKPSNSKGQPREMTETCYAILVLVLPEDVDRAWRDQELEIIKVVADHVAVALWHASVLEESQMAMDKLAVRNRGLQQATENAMKAIEEWNSLRNILSHGMRRPVHSMLGSLSIIQHEISDPEQRLIVDTMFRTSTVVAALINDIMEGPDSSKSLSLDMKVFQLHATIKQAATFASCLCRRKGFGFGIQIENAVPNLVIGDERRTFRVILHMVGNLLDEWDGGLITFCVLCDSRPEEKHDQISLPRKATVSDGYAYVKFEVAVKSDSPSSSALLARRPRGGNVSSSICKKIVQMMQGNVWVVPSSQGPAKSMISLLRFQLQTTGNSGESSGHARPPSRSLFMGLRGSVNGG